MSKQTMRKASLQVLHNTTRREGQERIREVTRQNSRSNNRLVIREVEQNENEGMENKEVETHFIVEKLTKDEKVKNIATKKSCLHFSNTEVVEEANPEWSQDQRLQVEWDMLFYYFSADDDVRNEQFQFMTNYKIQLSPAFRIIEDLNSFLHASEKQGGDAVHFSQTLGFRNYINVMGLTYMGYQGSPFTWTN
ncbi:hypothetical protein GH714_006883 [Hevea brasiliensis]|uniref:Uncharacterized protein n=1 Tax=Hevea brasiliensis TaxID=3981 RepID=A0A6A6LBZ8_HEVBR|nr:hypothetical protein GH714_006883 [Hevea brasiliensis]